MKNEVTQSQIDAYVVGATTTMPINDRRQLDSMVVLHYDIPFKQAHIMVGLALTESIRIFEYKLKMLNTLAGEATK